MQSTITFLPHLRRLVVAFRKNPVHFIWHRFISFKHDVKCFFFPHNVVKVPYLNRTWCDRDELMFHAIFQILVDFVELETPFISWDDARKLKIKRHTDRAEMRAFIEKWHNTPEGIAATYYQGDSDQDKKSAEDAAKFHYAMNMEILNLYEWYKDEKFDLDKFVLYEKTGQRLKMGKNGIEKIDTGKPKLITWEELHKIEDDHKEMVDDTLQRVLKVRRYLWT